MVSLSVIIPSKGRLATLEKVWSALVTQERITRDDYEIIIVADGLDEPESLPFPAPPDGPSCVYERIPHSGPAKARNHGFSKSRGNIVLFLGNDTIPNPQLLHYHLQFHEQFPQTLCVGHISQSGQSLSPNLDIFLRRGAQFEMPTADGNIDFWRCYSANLSLPRDLFIALNGFAEIFPAAGWEDVEFGYRGVAMAALRYCRAAAVVHEHMTSLAEFVDRQILLGEHVHLLLDLHPELDRVLKLKSYPVRKLGKKILASEALVTVTKKMYGWIEKLAYSGLVHYYFRIVRYQYFYRGYTGNTESERGRQKR